MLEKIGATVLCSSVVEVLVGTGYLPAILFLVMFIDYLTGTILAIKSNTWSAANALKGILKKGTGLCGLGIAIVLDLLIIRLIEVYPTLIETLLTTPKFCMLVLIWHILTELGSITENLGLLGVPIPAFFKQHLQKLKDTLDE